MLKIFKERRNELKAVLKYLDDPEGRLKDHDGKPDDEDFVRKFITENRLLLYTDGTDIRSDDPDIVMRYLQKFANACRSGVENRIRTDCPFDGHELRAVLIADDVRRECEYAMTLLDGMRPHGNAVGAAGEQ